MLGERLIGVVERILEKQMQVNRYRERLEILRLEIGKRILNITWGKYILTMEEKWDIWLMEPTN